LHEQQHNGAEEQSQGTSPTAVLAFSVRRIPRER
jgi:hypothetical protein